MWTEKKYASQCNSRGIPGSWVIFPAAPFCLLRLLKHMLQCAYSKFSLTVDCCWAHLTLSRGDLRASSSCWAVLDTGSHDVRDEVLRLYQGLPGAAFATKYSFLQQMSQPCFESPKGLHCKTPFGTCQRTHMASFLLQVPLLPWICWVVGPEQQGCF